MPEAAEPRPTGPAPTAPPRLPAGARVTAGILLAIPLVALAGVPWYSRETPRALGFPFFYWFQLLWVLITPVLTYAAYLVIKRARGER